MASQYIARHKETSIEVQVTFPTRLGEEELGSVKAVTDAFAHLLGQLQSSDPTYRQVVPILMAAILGSVDRIVERMQSEGRCDLLASVRDLGKGAQGQPFQFSVN